MIMIMIYDYDHAKCSEKPIISFTWNFDSDNDLDDHDDNDEYDNCYELMPSAPRNRLYPLQRNFDSFDDFDDHDD